MCFFLSRRLILAHIWDENRKLHRKKGQIGTTFLECDCPFFFFLSVLKRQLEAHVFLMGGFKQHGT